MIVLLLLLLYIILYNLQSISRKNNFFYLIAFLFLFLFYNFDNHSLHPDIEPYQNVFYSMSDSYKKSMDRYNWEYGYGLLNYVIHHIYPNFNLFYLIYSIILIVCNLITIKRYAVSPFLTFTLYFLSCFLSLFLMRQYIAMSICLLTIPYIIKRKIFPFILLSLIAATFHTTSFIWLLTYFIYKIPINVKGIIIFVGGAIIIGNSISVLLENMVELELFSKLDSYISDDVEEYTWKNFFISFMTLLYFILVLKKDVLNLNGVMKFFFLLYCVSLCFDVFNMLGTSFTAFYRLKLFYSFASVYLISYATMHIRNVETRTVAAIFFIVLNIYLANNTIESQGGLDFVI